MIWLFFKKPRFFQPLPTPDDYCYKIYGSCQGQVIEVRLGRRVSCKLVVVGVVNCAVDKMWSDLALKYVISSFFEITAERIDAGYRIWRLSASAAWWLSLPWRPFRRRRLRRWVPDAARRWWSPGALRCRRRDRRLVISRKSLTKSTDTPGHSTTVASLTRNITTVDIACMPGL